MDTVLVACAPILHRQHALITRAQVISATNSWDAAGRLVARGVWERVDHGVYGPVGVPMTWRRRLMLALLLAPETSLVSHRAAGTMLGVGGLIDPAPEITVPRGTSLRRPWLITHESRDLDLATPRMIDGIACTGPVRLAVDLGAVVSPSRYIHAVREIRNDHDVSSERLLRAYLRHKRRGRNGCGPLRAWLDRYFALDGGAPESGLEQHALDAILDAGLPAPTLQLVVDTDRGRYRVDMAYPGLGIVIEIDGAQHRDDPSVVANDRVRTAALRRAGWQHVLRIRSWRFATDLDVVLCMVRTLHAGSGVRS